MEEVSVAEAFSRFKPESCIFVISGGNKPNGMIAGWHMRCSMDPPLFAVSLKNNKNTHKLIRESKEFVVAVANKELEKELLFFGSRTGKDVDKFKETGIEIVKGKSVKSPLIKKATINYECVLVDEVEAGDHIIFIGKIVHSYLNKGKILFNMRKEEGVRVFEEF